MPESSSSPLAAFLLTKGVRPPTPPAPQLLPISTLLRSHLHRPHFYPLVDKNPLALIAWIHHVINRSLKVHSKFPRHPETFTLHPSTSIVTSDQYVLAEVIYGLRHDATEAVAISLQRMVGGVVCAVLMEPPGE